MALDTNFIPGAIDAVNSLVGANKFTIANALFTNQESLTDFRSKHIIRTGVRNGSKVPIVNGDNPYSSLSKEQDGCEMNKCSLDTRYSHNIWTVGDYNCRIEICLKNFNEDFLFFWGAYKQKLEDPLENPDFQAFIAYFTSIAQKRLEGTLWRNAYHGDTTSQNELISGNNGLWVEAESGNGIKRETAKTSDGKAIYDKLLEVYEEATNQDWFDADDFVWRMSYALANKIISWLNGLNDASDFNCGCIDPNKVTATRKFSVDNLTLFGIPVKAYREHDRALVKGLGGTVDYRALLIDKNNFLIGINTEDSLKQFDIFFDKLSKKFYIDLYVQIGTSIPLDEELLMLKFNQ